MREYTPHSLSTKKEVVKTKVQPSYLMLFFRITFLRSLVKWILRKLSGLCELQRIIKKHKAAERTFRIEKCLLMSKCKQLKDVVDADVLEDLNQAVSDIMQIKDIIPEADPPFESALTTCILQIRGYKKLFDEVEELRSQSYDCNNTEHEKELLKLWKLLKPDQELTERICKDWCSIGFQGSDPKTDFRGMGILGLKCMIYFAEKHGQHAHQMLQHSYHPTLGYSYAIVSINMTALAYDLLQKGKLRSHFYSQVQGEANVSEFFNVFCCIFSQFDKYWFESKPENVMAFNRIRENYALQLEIHLRPENNGCLKMEQASDIS